jgi:hypothetical protein
LQAATLPQRASSDSKTKGQQDLEIHQGVAGKQDSLINREGLRESHGPRGDNKNSITLRIVSRLRKSANCTTHTAHSASPKANSTSYVHLRNQFFMNPLASRPVLLLTPSSYRRRFSPLGFQVCRRLAWPRSQDCFG